MSAIGAVTVASMLCGTEVLYLQPWPDSQSDAPHERAVARETIELTFIVAVQHLPPRQRAVLIFRDVLGWPAHQTAAAGWGGGSLIYANVFARPSEETFRPHWPVSYSRASLDRYLDLAAHMLEIRPIQADPVSGEVPVRTRAMEDLVERIDWAAGTVRSAARLALRHPQLRRRLPGVGRGGLSSDRPYLRGFGTTRFLSDETFRNGEQAVLAVDVIALMDALQIESAIVAGFDWGARTADIVAAFGRNAAASLYR